MLGKLIKYEWKSTYKVCGALLLFMVLMTVLGCASFYTPMWSRAFHEAEIDNVTVLDVAGIFSLFLYIFAVIGVMWGSFIFLGVRFYRSMYSEEGYLTHTLPVTAHQILFSKILVSSLWYLAITLFMVISVVCLVFAVVNHAVVALSGDSNLWAELMQAWEEVWPELRAELRREFGMNINLLGVLYLIMILISPFSSIITLYGAITVGQLSSKHKVMMSIVSYFVINVVISIISTVVTLPITISQSIKSLNSYSNQVMVNSTGTYIVTIVLTIAIAAALYFASHYIITKKLNLE